MELHVMTLPLKLKFHAPVPQCCLCDSRDDHVVVKGKISYTDQAHLCTVCIVPDVCVTCKVGFISS